MDTGPREVGRVSGRQQVAVCGRDRCDRTVGKADPVADSSRARVSRCEGFGCAFVKGKDAAFEQIFQLRLERLLQCVAATPIGYRNSSKRTRAPKRASEYTNVVHITTYRHKP